VTARPTAKSVGCLGGSWRHDLVEYPVPTGYSDDAAYTQADVGLGVAENDKGQVRFTLIPDGLSLKEGSNFSQQTRLKVHYFQRFVRMVRGRNLGYVQLTISQELVCVSPINKIGKTTLKTRASVPASNITSYEFKIMYDFIAEIALHFRCRMAVLFAPIVPSNPIE
jgi:hypothetical protein